jgi:hypothetical protein
VVHPDLNRVLHAFEEVLPLLEGSDDHKHLLFMDHVVLLDIIQALGVEGNGAPLSIHALLQQNGPSCLVRTVSSQYGRDSSGRTRMGPAVTVSLRAWNTAPKAVVQVQATPFFVRSKSGRETSENTQINL